MIVGDTFSTDFPTKRPLQDERDGIRDIFITKLVIGVEIFGDENLHVEQVAAGMLEPRAMGFVGPDDVLVLEDRGWIRHVRNGVLQPQPLLELPVDRAFKGQPYSMAVHPMFPAQPWIYFYFTEAGPEDGGEPLGNRVYRYQWDNGALTNPELILDVARGPVPGEEGGAIAFGIGGKLYVSSGDMGSQSELQNVVAGAPPDDSSVIFRLNDDGSTPADNPFFALGGPFARYFGYGIHSVTAMAVDPVTDALWAADNGRDAYDEINRVDPGFNGGWSQLVGPQARHEGSAPELVEFAGSSYQDPLFAWLDPVVPAAMTFLGTNRVGDHYLNQLFVGDASTGSLHRFKPNARRDGLLFASPDMRDGVADDDVEASESLFGAGFGSIADLDVGPDGLLYVLSSSRGGLYRVSWRSDVELVMRSTIRFVARGGHVPVEVHLENHAADEVTFGLVLSMRLPGGEEPIVVGPVPVTMPGGASGSFELPLEIPADAELGEWSFKGQLFGADPDNPVLLDRSAVDFEVVEVPAQ